MNKLEHRPLFASLILFTSLAFGIPLAIQSSPTFSNNIRFEHWIGFAIIVIGAITTQILVSLSARQLHRRVSYYRIIPLLYWPLGTAVAIMKLWEHSQHESPPVQDQRNFVLSALRGNEPLFIAVVGMIVPVVIFNSSLLGLVIGSQGIALSSTFFLTMLAIDGALLIAASVAMWRCSPNTDERFKTWLARSSLVVNWLFIAYKIVSNYA